MTRQKSAREPDVEPRSDHQSIRKPFEGLVYQARCGRAQHAPGIEPPLGGEPADRIAAYLDDLAIRAPGAGVSYPKVAQAVFCLPREPSLSSIYVRAIRQELAKVDRRLQKEHGRRLLRFGRQIRASVSDADADKVLRTRRFERTWRLVRSTVAKLRLVSPEDISDPAIREDYFATIQTIHDGALRFLDPADQEWVRRTLKRRASIGMS